MESLQSCILCEGAQIETLCAQNAFCRCKECGLVFDNPRPSWAEIVQFYAKEDQYDSWLAEEDARDALWKRRLRLVRKHCKNGKLLDVGSGIGQFLKHARRYFEVSGTEISPTAIEIAKTRYGIELKQGTIDEVKFDEKFDVVTLFHVLEHVPAPAETLRICRQFLKPDGILVIAVPNDVESILTRRNRFMEKRGVEKYQTLGKLGLPKLTLQGSEIHVSHFTASSLASALDRTGFEVIENSLDPCFAVSGMRKMRRYRRYYWYKAIHAATGNNLYDAIWMVAKVRG